jgi:hypothetical protein
VWFGLIEGSGGQRVVGCVIAAPPRSIERSAYFFAALILQAATPPCSLPLPDGKLTASDAFL